MSGNDRYACLEIIGNGSFGVIRKVKRKSDGLILCRKEISYSKMLQREREQLRTEVSVLKGLRHPNIIAYFECDDIEATQELHLYVEYCQNGDLCHRIKIQKRSGQLADEEFIWNIFSQIVSALYRCHNGDVPPAGDTPQKERLRNRKTTIVHRDLKPENILLGEDDTVKLADFGLSKILQSNDFASTIVGTPFYMCPEIVKGENYGVLADIWALGCIVYEMCAQEPPFNANTHAELIRKIKRGYYPPIPSCYSQELKDVIASCLSVVPKNRPDTALLSSLPMMRLMRAKQEIRKLEKDLERQKQSVSRSKKELQDRLQESIQNSRMEIDSQLRREWEAKARLEIDRQVRILVERQIKYERSRLKQDLASEVEERVRKALEDHSACSTASPMVPSKLNETNVLSDQSHFLAQDTSPITVQGSGISHANSGLANEDPIVSQSSDGITRAPVANSRPKKPSNVAHGAYNQAWSATPALSFTIHTERSKPPHESPSNGISSKASVLLLTDKKVRNNDPNRDTPLQLSRAKKQVRAKTVRNNGIQTLRLDRLKRL